MSDRATAVLYLDIDGTVREGRDDPLGRFVNAPEDVRVFPAAVAMMREWKRRGGRIIGVSNQGGIALGHVTEQQVAAAMIETHHQAERLFDRIVFCRHHPAADRPEMARCWCRKPAPGMLIEAALEAAARHGETYPPHLGLMVGDRPEDQQCARSAGLNFVWAADWRGQATPHPAQGAGTTTP